ncbi:hypothetical protein [Vibrio fluvialis]|uniref:hypothetical protein n=1 Tax=Vibrio fluvialis TaxID=676 RepID=UPI00301C9A07
MLTEDDYFSDDENEEYRVPTFPLTSFNSQMLEDYKEHVANNPSHVLADYVHQYLKQENAIARKLQDWAHKSHYLNLAERMNISPNLNSGDPLDWLDFLIKIATKAEKILEIDHRAMQELSKNDPGAYAQSLLYRRAWCNKGEDVGDFHENHLRSYLSPKSSETVDDHIAWYLYIESRPLQPISQDIKRITSTPPPTL